MAEHALAQRLLRADSEITTNAREHWAAWVNGEIPADWPLQGWVSTKNAFSMDGEEHRRQRALFGPALAPRKVANMGSSISKVIAERLDILASKEEEAPGQSIDLREEYFAPIQAMVIGRFVGTDGDKFRAAVTGMFDSKDAARVQAAAAELTAHVHELVQEKRDAPAEDLTSDLLRAWDPDSGTRLSDEEVQSIILMITAAGYETTVGTLTRATANICSHPHQRALVQGGTATWHDVVEETLRLQPALALRIMRAVRPGKSLHDEETGVSVCPGAPVALHYGAIGLDQDVHGEDAAEFDIQRPTRGKHLSFGYGPHVCPGRSLALLVATTALEALFERYRDLQLAVPPQGLPGPGTCMSNGHASLPVFLTPAPS
ncbi:cytochrome P450 [Streptomyces sp. PU-14G]|uniref:cytochrome P450 n=1 Tax=Streptomyces sp. PU-14G TaxID=2800808 RepID=UPI0034DF4796